MAEFNLSIELNNVSKKIRGKNALDGLSTRFNSQMLHGLIGSDGAGKTTLLRVLVGLLRPDSGEVVYKEKMTPVYLKSIRHKIAYLPQQQSLYPDLSCREHLEFFRDLYRIPHDIYVKRSGELLHITRLEKFTNRKAGKLSGGMYKKLGIMCVLLQSPEVLLLDEPTNGVDPISRRELWELLYRLVSEKILVITSTAYMDEAERCDNVHLLESGKVFISGPPSEVLKNCNAGKFEDIFMQKAGIKKYELLRYCG